MNEFDLPPERRLPDGVKQQMKRDLINETAPPTPRRGKPGWIAAGVAAVAVAAMAIGGAVLLGGDNEAAPEPLAPAGSGTANDPVPSSPPTKPVDPADPDGDGKPEQGAHTTDDSALPPPTPTSCKDEVAEFGENQGLPGATERATATYDGGKMSLWGTDDRWVVCDDWAAANGGSATLIGNHPWPTGALSKQLFQISMNFGGTGDEPAQYFSGGPVPDGVKKIEYHFSDGETVAATIGEDMWSMVHIVVGEIEPDASGKLTARVVVTMEDGQTQEFRLLTDLSSGGDLKDFCAQLNHGC